MIKIAKLSDDENSEKEKDDALPAKFLRFCAGLSVLGGLVAAIGLFNTTSSFDKANNFYLMLAIGAFVQGIFTCAFFVVIAQIADSTLRVAKDLSIIRQGIKAQTDKE